VVFTCVAIGVLATDEVLVAKLCGNANGDDEDEQLN